ncbi:release factor glutamine methyltransferase [Motilibacter peucedani]|uniref:Release factor glutamine methyltransferase n=1 Tax=Motilibacter peucedani TaxID=598650 RepID=A0A420XLT9_9ACTN|nr:peptide chain release factor N(5)-glutamine methyltransferase [Motilibacter peucedani]RKS71369.1 release factor glutamine methyltransferase [Motilibacter peucedani]
MTSVRAAVAEAARRLAAAGVPSPRVDAEELAAHVLGVERRDLARPAVGDCEVPDAYAVLVAQREARVPLQHLTGAAYFRYLVLAVGPGVFVPRPETEVVAQAAIDAARALSAPRVVDLGTGSGAIAVAVATEVPGSEVFAVEADPLAHAWAARNVEGTGVELRLGDFATAFPDLDGSVDVVVSNPPYIPPDAVPLDPEVREHDPELALYGGGEDGLAALRVVERTARRLLRAGGLLVAEHADSQGDSAPAVLRAAAAWDDVADVQDLAGRPRYVTARRRGEQP